ncbi:MAG: beta-N-acetylhexosaminidase, partial [Flavobacteriaceae bacterium]|nr:beta-N-acetylhexosaminidase [Flavobacteriaceae bacterium]
MSFKRILLLSVFISILFTCKYENLVVFENTIIPKPLNVKSLKGNFVLNSKLSLEFDSSLKVSALYLKNYIESGSNIKFANKTLEKKIQFTKDISITKPEAYKLEIKPSKIEIKSATDQGAFYAVQSLRQLLPIEFENGTYNKDKVIIPSIIIDDAPQFKYRGMHLDVGRHLYSVQ